MKNILNNLNMRIDTICTNRPRLKKKIINIISSTFLTTESFRYLLYQNNSIEQQFVDLLAKYFKKYNISSEISQDVCIDIEKIIIYIYEINNSFKYTKKIYSDINGYDLFTKVQGRIEENAN